MPSITGCAWPCLYREVSSRAATFTRSLTVFIEREPYQPAFDWAAANGDWPAIHWAGVEQPGLSVALLNQGTPSYRIETSQDGDTEIILLSLLRSPAIPTYLHEPYFYSMLDYDGMRDAGDHCFTYALEIIQPAPQ
jgi:hypothetical protein